MNFKTWLEVGASGGVGSGMVPEKENPTGYRGAFADYYGEKDKDPRNPKGQLPPVKKKMKK